VTRGSGDAWIRVGFCGTPGNRGAGCISEFEVLASVKFEQISIIARFIGGG
jgi:hypothetical protein